MTRRLLWPDGRAVTGAELDRSLADAYDLGEPVSLVDGAIGRSLADAAAAYRGRLAEQARELFGGGEEP